MKSAFFTPQLAFLIDRFKVMEGAPLAFGPRIDVERKNPFFPKHPAEIIKSGSFNHVPLIMGVNTNEAGFIVASQFMN